MSLLTDKERIELFPIFKTCTYLNTASTGVIPETAIAEQDRFMNFYRAETLQTQPESFEIINKIKQKVAILLGAESDEIALVNNTSLGICMAGWGIEMSQGDVIALPPGEFPANVYPWKGLEVRGAKVYIAEQDGEEFLDVDNLRVLAPSWIRFYDGYRIDIQECSRIAKKHNALLSVDGIQGAGVMYPDLKNSGVDAFSAGAQKWLLSPTGTGILFVRKDAPIRSIFQGWLNRFLDTLDFTNVRKYEIPEPRDASRFEIGSYPYQALFAMHASVSFLVDIGIHKIQVYTLRMAEMFVDECKALGLKVISVGGKRRSPIVAVYIPEAVQVHQKLQEKKILCSCREGNLRFSFHVYNNERDIEKTIDVLKTAIK
ncbi:MAG TPA: aminotransferase class V-fold PLP-dependent enzyme [Candidatus Cloacimonetes bacterium]|nr:aminotransferase class V-fold PLP-dependent enzyme [Candidatus Cloacimonadota bacterium]HEX38372.1 aminotransferase class V-fold PLP-dependent enzyme [Candidatus Cloacimonadota bacterium]